MQQSQPQQTPQSRRAQALVQFQRQQQQLQANNNSTDNLNTPTTGSPSTPEEYDALTPAQARTQPRFNQWFTQMEAHGYTAEQINSHFMAQIAIQKEQQLMEQQQRDDMHTQQSTVNQEQAQAKAQAQALMFIEMAVNESNSNNMVLIEHQRKVQMAESIVSANGSRMQMEQLMRKPFTQIEKLHKEMHEQGLMNIVDNNTMCNTTDIAVNEDAEDGILINKMSSSVTDIHSIKHQKKVQMAEHIVSAYGGRVQMEQLMRMPYAQIENLHKEIMSRLHEQGFSIAQNFA